MHNDYLVRMANDISRFFSSDPNQEEAAASVLAHVRRFWDPRMRAQIVEYYRAGGTGLTDLASKAISRLAEEAAAAQK